MYQHILGSCNTTETSNEHAALFRVLSLYGGNILIGHSGILCEVCMTQILFLLYNFKGAFMSSFDPQKTVALLSSLSQTGWFRDSTSIYFTLQARRTKHSI